MPTLDPAAAPAAVADLDSEADHDRSRLGQLGLELLRFGSGAATHSSTWSGTGR
ncbi:MAG: hypothetical protein ACRDNS_27445 [Trebonia sp.]